MDVAAHLGAPGNIARMGASVELSRRAEMQQSEVPLPGERAVVRCAGFQCLAYLDSEGAWRDAIDRKRLPKVLEIVFRF